MEAMRSAKVPYLENVMNDEVLLLTKVAAVKSILGFSLKDTKVSQPGC
jgi:hypothetical protein